MKMRFACPFLLTFFLAIPAWSRAHPHSTKQETPADAGYVFALAAANHFLHAWQTGDIESGMVLLSDGLRHSQNADKMEEFFSSKATRSFEITSGHRNSGRYIFPIVLVTSRGAHVVRKVSEITLVEAGKLDWVVDKLP